MRLKLLGAIIPTYQVQVGLQNTHCDIMIVHGHLYMYLQIAV
jgi:hypothetical protein